MEPFSYSQRVNLSISPSVAELKNKKRRNRKRAELQKASRKINRRK